MVRPGYLSTDAVLDNGDQNLAAKLPHHGAGGRRELHGDYHVTTTPATAPGSYTLFIKADGHGATIGSGTNTDGGSLAEGNEANNTRH
jgi:hypothetical protein